MKKSRKGLSKDYTPYEEVSLDENERLLTLCDRLTKDDLINLAKNVLRIKRIKKKKIKLVFYIIPEGIARPRLGMGGRFYVPNAGKFNRLFQDYLDENPEVKNTFITTPCKLSIKYFLPMPKAMSKIEKILAEKQLIRPTCKPDWDNVGKCTDMFNERLIMDDAYVVDARVRKYYSLKPRLEIKIEFLDSYDCTFNEKRVYKCKKFLERVDSK